MVLTGGLVSQGLSLGRDITHDEPRLSVGVGQRTSCEDP
jgi:hypothetical protein